MKGNYFSWFLFSGREARGFAILVVLLVLVYFTPDLYLYCFPPEKVDFRPFVQQILRYQKRERNLMAGNARSSELFAFDPNSLSETGWVKLGLSPKQAGAIIRYRAKGGRFRKPEDLARMYTMPAEAFSRIRRYIHIIDTPVATKFRPAERPAGGGRILVQSIDINTADSVQLDALKGIGPAFASRIIRYRERLGGFVSAEQLMEVFGMDSLRHQLLLTQVVINPKVVRQLYINKAEFNDLKNHPYLRYGHINAILRYRAQHGKFTTIGDLRKVMVLNDEIIRKIEPYLLFDHD